MQDLKYITLPALALLLAATAAGAQSDYTISDLGSLAGDSYANSINNRGQVTGTYYTQHGYSVFVYSNGTLTDLGNVGPLGDPFKDPDHSTAAAYGINDSGQIVGQYTYRSLGPRGQQHNEGGAFLYQQGQIKSIGGYSDGYASGLQSAKAINNAGQIVGYDIYGKAALYQNGITTKLDVGPDSDANAINNSGVIVGDTIANNLAYGYYYQNGVQHLLPQLSASNPGAVAKSVNDNGAIVGGSNVSAKYGHATLWQNGQVIDLGSFGASSDAYDINNNGVIVGEATEPNGQHGAFVYQKGQITDLLAGTIWHDGKATAINDSGQIVGWATLPDGSIHAFLATPNAVPEPGSLLAFGVGTGVMLLAVRRRSQRKRAK